MPRAVVYHKARREEDFEEDYDDEAYELSEEEEAQAPRSRTARKPKKLAYSDEDSSSEVEEELRPRKSKKKARARKESEDEESDDGRGKALVVRPKTSKAVAKRGSSPKSKKKSRKVEESDDDDDDDDGEETMKVERYKNLDIGEIKSEFLNALMDVFERDFRKVHKWVSKGLIRGDLKTKEYDIGPVLDKECSKKDREKWGKYVKKTKKSKSKWIFQLMDEDDPYSVGSVSHTFVPYPTSIYDETPIEHRTFKAYCEACLEHGHPCGRRCGPACPALASGGYYY
ncbi:MAG: hypothetical protein LQ342_000294 [Letrouitia transgressa]|nr:MAG: hypothetical protein LQ342_000294 [Letrouitia transgressa]